MKRILIETEIQRICETSEELKELDRNLKMLIKEGQTNMRKSSYRNEWKTNENEQLMKLWKLIDKAVYRRKI